MIKHTLLPVALATGMSTVVLVPGQDVAPAPPAEPSPPTVVSATTVIAIPATDATPSVVSVPVVAGVPSVATAPSPPSEVSSVVAVPMVDVAPSVIVARSVRAVEIAPGPAAVATVAIPMAQGRVVRVAPRSREIDRRIEELVVVLKKTELSYERNILIEELRELKQGAQEAAPEASDSRPARARGKVAPRGRGGEVRAQSGRIRIEKVKAAIEALEAAGEHEAAVALARKLERTIAQRKAEQVERQHGEMTKREAVAGSIRKELAHARQLAEQHEQNGEHDKAAVLRERIKRGVARVREHNAQARASAKGAASREHARQGGIRKRLNDARREIKVLIEAGEHKKAEVIQRRLVEAERQIEREMASHGDRQLDRETRPEPRHPRAPRAESAPRGPRADGRRPAPEPRGSRPDRDLRRHPPRPDGVPDASPEPGPRSGRSVVRRARADGERLAGAKERLAHLQLAAENLAAAGLAEEARRVQDHAKMMATELRAQAERQRNAVRRDRRHGPDDLESLKREVSELHAIVREIKRQVEAYHRDRE